MAALLTCATTSAMAQPPPAPAKPARTAWQVTLTQIDKSGTLVGDPKTFACTPTGCEQPITLDIEGKPFPFMAALTFVTAGAYVALQPMRPEIRKVIEFEKGFQGAIFLQARQDSPFSAMLRFVLIGPALAESEANSPQLMPSNRGLVFHRRLVPDLSLRLELTPQIRPEKPAE